MESNGSWNQIGTPVRLQNLIGICLVGECDWHLMVMKFDKKSIDEFQTESD